MREALLYEKLKNKKVRCNLCPHHCVIEEAKRGICGVKENKEGTLYSLVYGRAVASGVDPIEKKPFFHFFPGSYAFSIATVGCNFSCLFCQNADISQFPKEKKEIIGEFLPPEEIVSYAKRNKCKSISYTYTEPTIFFEYAYETAKIAHQQGIKNNFVTNGFISKEAIKLISPYLDAANVDLKSFGDDFYKKFCGARLQPVLDSLKLMKELGIWVEVTTLIIPTLNDSAEELKSIAEFILGLGQETPWHISRFYPHYKMADLPPTPVETLHKAREIGKKAGLNYVYSGNVPGDEGENTFCPHCGKKVISRYGFQSLENRLKEGKCPYCGTKIAGVGM